MRDQIRGMTGCGETVSSQILPLRFASGKADLEWKSFIPARLLSQTGLVLRLALFQRKTEVCILFCKTKKRRERKEGRKKERTKKGSVKIISSL